MNAMTRLAFEPPACGRAAMLLRAARTATAQRRQAVARPLLEAARALAPEPQDLADAECRVLLLEGRAAEALAVLDAALGLDPLAQELRLLRAETRLRASDPAGAAVDAADVVLARRGGPAAKAVLGVALAECGRAEDAVACLRDAASDTAVRPSVWVALAWAQQALGQADVARATLDAAIVAAPLDLAIRTAALRLALAQRDPARAAALGLRAQAEGVVDAMLLGLLGHALSCLDQPDAARAAYAAALLLAPEDRYVRHMANSGGGAQVRATQAPAEYLRTVFDGYADQFEAHLIALGYRVPGLLRRMALAHARWPDGGGALGPVLDLGCGTGLVAVALSDLALGPWHGVDLSPAMLAHAADKGLYARLDEADIDAVLARPGPRYPLVLAADVFCYFGPLAMVFLGVAGRLSAGGMFMLSVESLPPATPGKLAEDWVLGPRGRYAHSPAYLAACAAAAGLVVLELRPEILRREGDAPVAGLLMVLTRP